MRKWFILFIVLLCAIFAASSGCGEKSNGNVTKVTVENSNENITPHASGNSNLSAPADKVGGDAETPSKDSGKETNVKIESTDSSVGKTETKIVSTGNSGDWCPVGSSWSTVNPQTGEMANMKVTGTETVDGITMCKAVYESNVNDNNYTRWKFMQ